MCEESWLKQFFISDNYSPKIEYSHIFVNLYEQYEL